MALLRFLISLNIIILCPFLLISCFTKSVTYKSNIFENDNYIIDSIEPEKDYSHFLSDENVSKEGDYVFKGKKVSPFGDVFKDDSGIHIDAKPDIDTKIIFYKENKKKEKNEYAGKISLKPINVRREIKISRSDMGKIFEPSAYKIIILENGTPILRYTIFLLY